MKNAFSLVALIIFFVMLSSGGVYLGLFNFQVKGDICQDPLGGCPRCDERCKGKHGPTAQGNCDINQQCICYNTCGPSPRPPKQNGICYGGVGLCSSACNENCAQKYSGGAGFCEHIGGSSLCKCQYPC
ncbi:unnamed protein product [Eruca vesicaria subsp. sativa]|uniref:Defensin-like protein n=1 Tax=Eruca vesicaria subsp. sativa TaxID=29727 RepID=A0ABC8JE34_ERUVS|nr:unnamed protein product [Eruca vesicaria subsp. sativa]